MVRFHLCICRDCNPISLTHSHIDWLFCRYFGTVSVVKDASDSDSLYEICVKFGDGTQDKFRMPNEDVEKLPGGPEDEPELYPEEFCIGDTVDVMHQNGNTWYRGSIARVGDCGSACDVMYYDGDYEAGIPTKEKKIRLIERCDLNEDWLVGKRAMLKAFSGDRIGTVSKSLVSRN